MKIYYEHLEKRLKVTKSQVSNIITEFEKQLLILKIPDGKNKKIVHLTANRGLKLAQKLFQEFHAKEEFIFNNLYMRYQTKQLEDIETFERIMDMFSRFKN